MEDAMKESQEKTTHRKNLKRKAIVEDEVKLENALDPERDEDGEEIDEDVALCVKESGEVYWIAGPMRC
ncbi:hypothetical protein HAX54_019221 [Datura stramonium]|uniref:Uncharacterized protein n=1 Tax=Datura stramonium TaxID=4076 RepID=A0ABS8UR38_DATST|nr:hypothetical protein [Datura stramonium]